MGDPKATDARKITTEGLVALKDQEVHH